MVRPLASTTVIAAIANVPVACALISALAPALVGAADAAGPLAVAGAGAAAAAEASAAGAGCSSNACAAPVDLATPSSSSVAATYAGASVMTGCFHAPPGAPSFHRKRPCGTLSSSALVSGPKRPSLRKQLNAVVWKSL